MDRSEKVQGITKENYQDVVNRAQEFRQRLKSHYEEHNGFPSLRFAIEKWGFQMSLKAAFRHRKAIMEELGLTEVGRPTHSLPRPKKAPKNVEKATVEAVEAAEVTEESTVE